MVNYFDIACLTLALACIARGWGLRARLGFHHQVGLDLERATYKRAADRIFEDHKKLRDKERKATLEALYALEKNPFEPEHHALLRAAITMLEEALGVAREPEHG